MNVSIIVRTKNEEEWIAKCLYSVVNQDYKDKEIIVVDSGSTDKTLEIVKKYPVKLVHYKGDYFPGKALNLGVKNSKGKYLIFLSAHCIPLNDKWIERFLVCFHEKGVGGVYGRQEPLPDTSVIDKRDLWTIFGAEKRVQKEDCYFHNANSIIPRELWDKVNFNEELPSLEDRAWAKKIISMGYKIVYEPHASVYHPHGVNQGYNIERAQRVVKVIELLQGNGNI